jgi:hypothetical protein
VAPGDIRFTQSVPSIPAGPGRCRRVRGTVDRGIGCGVWSGVEGDSCRSYGGATRRVVRCRGIVPSLRDSPFTSYSTRHFRAGLQAIPPPFDKLRAGSVSSRDRNRRSLHYGSLRLMTSSVVPARDAAIDICPRDRTVIPTGVLMGLRPTYEDENGADEY